MSKIKIVQICNVGDEYPTEYLDDQGNVWFEQYVKDNGTLPGHYKWVRKELPEQP